MDDPAQPVKYYSYPRMLPASLWPDGSRSTWVTPLYLVRFRRAERTATIAAHSYWELILVLRGTPRLEFLREPPLELPAGSCALVPPDLPHRQLASEQDVLWIGLRGRALSMWPPDRVSRFATTDLAPWAELLWAWSRREHGAIGPELDHAAAFLLAAMDRRNAQPQPVQTASWLARVTEFIHDHLHQPLQVADLAALAGCSESHFHRQFKQATGETPLAFLNRLRLEAAAFYLTHTNDPIAAIARRVGFSDPLYFSRVCRRTWGRPPSALRCSRCRE